VAQHVIRQIDKLKGKIVQVAGVAENAFLRAIVATRDRDGDVAKGVIASDAELDELEVDVEEECLKLLALYQPVAVDLRLIISALKINNELERVGDLAVNIAERAQFLAHAREVKIPFDFLGMADKARHMLAKSIQALVDQNTALAREVCVSDDEVDALNREIYEQIKGLLKQQPESIEVLLHYLGIARLIERAADHATNIAEDVIYMVDGDIVRHRPEDYRDALHGRHGDDAHD
jgi:phosphate transport system protein